MKISLTFKTPDVVSDAVNALYEGEFSDDYDYEEKSEEAQQELSKWVQYGEYVTIDFDTDKGTAVVREEK